MRRFAPVVANEVELRQIAESDHLTGALTRCTWTIRAIAEIARSQRYGRALSRATRGAIYVATATRATPGVIENGVPFVRVPGE